MKNKLYNIYVILIFVSISSCGELQMPNYTGRYMLDVANSELGIYKDSIQYHQLILTINEDSTYEFGKDVPFIRDIKGKYGCKIEIGLIYHQIPSCFLITSEEGIEDRLFDYSHNVFYLLNIIPKEGKSKAKKLTFARI